MKKRPLALLCLAAVIFFAVSGMPRISKRNNIISGTADYLTALAGTGGMLSFECTVAKINAVSEGSRLSVDHIIISAKDNSKISVSSGLKFIMTIENDDLLPGDRLLVTGKYRPFEEAGNPGEFDEKDYYYAADTVGRISSADVLLVSEGGFSFKRGLAMIRRALCGSYMNILEEKEARTVSAICLGEKSLMDPEWKQLYQEGGIAHIISVSGLHISLAGMCIYKLLRRLRLPFAAAAPPSALMVTAYAVMAGFSVSAVRACIMFVIWLGSQVAGRKYDMTTAAAAAALIILAGDIRKLYQSSFLMSFCAVFAIAILVPRLQRANPFTGSVRGKLKTMAGKAPDKKKLQKLQRLAFAGWNALSGSAGIWLGTLPVTLYFFYQCAPWSILVNIIVVPLMSALMASGIAAGIIGLICIPTGTFAAAPVSYLLKLFERLCIIEQQFPCALWVAGCPSAVKIIIYYGILATAVVLAGFICRKAPGQAAWPGKSLSPAILWITAAVFCVIAIGYHSNSGLVITCFDVGQGDGALIEFPGGTNCLIDCGSTSENEVWEYSVSQSLKYYGVDTIDYVFLSHAHADHTNGIMEYLENYKAGFAGTNVHGITIKNLVLPPTFDKDDFSELRSCTDAARINVWIMESGAVAGSSEGAALTCLAPDSSSLCGDKNEDSMVLMLQYKNFRMLFTGDLGGDSEKNLVMSGADLSCDILKVGHHGSKYSSSEEFLTAAHPLFGIISCGENNVYGHPAAETVERLKDAGITICETMNTGAVIIHSDGLRYSVKSYK